MTKRMGNGRLSGHRSADVSPHSAPRQMLALGYIAEHPGCTNRQVAIGAGVTDAGQISRLLHRIEHLGLAVNCGTYERGVPNAWHITSYGELAVARGRNTSLSTHAR